MLALLLQLNLDYELLAVEDVRADAAPLVEALTSDSVSVRRQAIRALGRFERSELAEHVRPFLRAADPELRIEAANALAQMKSSADGTLSSEADPHVRAVLYESLARSSHIGADTMLSGLEEPESVRVGAIKGLEYAIRVNEMSPSTEVIAALRRAVRHSRSSKIRKLGLLALNRAGDSHRETLEGAWRDPDPLVRRLAILGLKEWRDDPSHIVRYAALKTAGNCERAAAALTDPSDHVALLAIDLLGDGCSAHMLRADPQDGWRRSARALVSLAKIDHEAAKKLLPDFVEHKIWQARVYAARAAKILGDETALDTLRSDGHPNVVAAALVTPQHALTALASNDFGLLMRALEILEDWNDRRAIPILLETLQRVSEQRKATSRDPRRLLLERLRFFGVDDGLDYLLEDFDPFIASLAAVTISENSNRMVQPKTTRFAPSPLPSEAYLSSLAGARARIQMKEAGSFVVELLLEEAPLTAAQFAKLAESGYYDGLTFHRIVPNFVLQGGSPGANEFVGTAGYIRDEVGLLSHERGTLGISTRGRDTGDSQIFINLVDNYRLDHNYTVFARVVAGMEHVDRIQEGDVMQSVKIMRR